jgi:hypothetical protein
LGEGGVWSFCATILRPLLNTSVHPYTSRCNKILPPYCADSFGRISAPLTPSAHKKGSLPAAHLQCVT